MGGRSRSRSRERAPGSRSTKARQYRVKREKESEANGAPSVRAQQLAALEDEVLRNVEEAVRVKVEESMASDEVNQRIAARLREERAKLEAAVNAQLAEEKAALMEKKRREQEEAKRKLDELERIHAENKRKVEAAQARAAKAAGEA